MLFSPTANDAKIARANPPCCPALTNPAHCCPGRPFSRPNLSQLTLALVNNNNKGELLNNGAEFFMKLHLHFYMPSISKATLLIDPNWRSRKYISWNQGCNATSVKSNKMGSHCARTTESSMMVIIVEKPIFWTLTVIAISFWVTQARLENNNKWVSLRAITNTGNNNKTSHFLANLGKIAIVHAVMYYM